MNQRIANFLQSENKSAIQFAKEIGIQSSSVSHIISERNKPSLDLVLKMIKRYPYLSKDWLLFGEGDMYLDDSSDNFPSLKEKHIEEKKQTSEEENVFQSAADSNLETLKEIEKIIFFYKNGTFRIFSSIE